MIEIKEILARLADDHSIRAISNVIGTHRGTIRNYINLTTGFGFDSNGIAF